MSLNHRLIKIFTTHLAQTLVAVALTASILIRYKAVLALPVTDTPGINDMWHFVHYYLRMKRDVAAALATDFTKLSSGYLYLWAAFVNLDIPAILVIRYITFAFDYLAVYWVFRLVALRYGPRTMPPYAAAAITSLLPYIIADNILWGQIDSVYASCLLGSVYFFTRHAGPHRKKHDTSYAIAWFTAAFCFKLQSSFFFPALAFFYASGRISLKQLCCVPALYVALQLPRVYLGLPLESMLSAYSRQISAYSGLSYNACNIFDVFHWLGIINVHAVGQEKTVGTWLGVAFGAALTGLFFLSGKRAARHAGMAQTLLICLLSLWLAPYVLSRIHERYFIPAELLSVPVAFYFPRLLWAPIGLDLVFTLEGLLYHPLWYIPSIDGVYKAIRQTGINKHALILLMAAMVLGLLRAYGAIYGNPFRKSARSGKSEHSGTPRFYILCGNAAWNRGDRGNLSSQITMLKERFPGAHIMLDSFRPEVDSQWYDAAIFPRSPLFLNWQQVRHIASADMVIWGGGSLIADNSSRLLIPFQLAVLFFIKMVLGKPVMAWAQGIVLETYAGACLGTLALNMADTITVRDKGSYEQLKRLPIFRPCRQTADPALLLQASPPETGASILRQAGIENNGKPLFAIAPTYWHLYHQRGDWLPYPMGKRSFNRSARRQQQVRAYNEGLTALADALVERYGATILLLPRYPSRDWNDLHYLETIKAASKYPERLHVFDDDSHPPNDYYAMWPCFDLLIGVALHDAIFSTAFDLPCVHLYYESKGKDFFEALGSTDRLLHWETLLSEEGRADIMHCAEHTLRNWPELQAAIRQKREILREEARSNLDTLEDLLKKARKWHAI